MRTVWEDLRYGFRTMAARPGFTAVAVFTLGLGIAANATVFNWINSVLLHPIPGATDSSRLIAVDSISEAGSRISSARGDIREFQREMTTVTGLTARHFNPFTIGEPETALHTWGEIVFVNYFDVLGVKPALGRTFRAEEDSESEGASPVVIVSHRLWRQTFQGDPAVIGKPVRVNGRMLTLIGVMPPEFHGSLTGVMLDVWAPASLMTTLGAQARWIPDDHYTRCYDIIARLKSGATVTQASAEVDALARRLAQRYPLSNRDIGARAYPLRQGRNGAHYLLREPLMILMAVSVLVLLIACANVSNLLLARSVARQREFGIRVAMGAGQQRLIRQMLTEVLLLASAGAAVGVLISLWMAQSLFYLLPKTELPIGIEVPVNGAVIGFTALICLVATVIAAAAPAVYAARTNINTTLKEGARSTSAGAGPLRLRSVLVVAEVTLAMVATVTAGLFLRSFRNAQAVEPGFNRDNVMIARFYLSSAGYATAEERLFSRKLLDRLSGAGAIGQATYADWVPLSFGEEPWNNIFVEGAGMDREPKMSRTLAGPGFFSLMRIPMLAGREFLESDDATHPYVIIVNESFVRRYLPNSDPIGRRVKVDGTWSRIVGVARDIRNVPPGFAEQPYFFLSYQQAFGRGHSTFFYVRPKGDVASAMAALRREVAALDPSTGLFDVLTLREMTEASLYSQKVAASLVGGLGILSLLLAALGLYSVMAYSVTERTRDLAIRMALGARPRAVLRLVLSDGMRLTAVGLAAGCVAALAGGRVLSAIPGMLVNLSGMDPAAFVGAGVFLIVVAVAACYVPARRATRVDPMDALRSQ